MTTENRFQRCRELQGKSSGEEAENPGRMCSKTLLLKEWSISQQHRHLLKVKVAQFCSTLCDPMDYSPWNSPGKNTGVGSLSLLQGIFPIQGPNQVSHTVRAEPQGKPNNTRGGSLSPLQQIFPTQESNRGLLHCRQIPYQLSYQGSPESLEEISQKRGCRGLKMATHSLLLLSPRDAPTSPLQICTGLWTNSDQSPAGETTCETPQ